MSMTEGIYSCPRLHDLHPDWLFAQHLPSALASHVLAPGPNDRVLDMCAAPGGKTTHISTLMSNSGSIIALERLKTRCQILRENVARWGADNVEVRAMDASNASRVLPANSFSKVLLDAPCSETKASTSARPGSRHSGINFRRLCVCWASKCPPLRPTVPYIGQLSLHTPTVLPSVHKSQLCI